VAVPRKFDVAVQAVLVDQLEDLAPSHGDHLFGGRETAIVSHDPTDQTGPQKHIRPFDQHDLRTLFASGQG
jgi:hypothetical protein